MHQEKMSNSYTSKSHLGRRFTSTCACGRDLQSHRAVATARARYINSAQISSSRRSTFRIMPFGDGNVSGLFLLPPGCQQCWRRKTHQGRPACASQSRSYPKLQMLRFISVHSLYRIFFLIFAFIFHVMAVSTVSPPQALR